MALQHGRALRVARGRQALPVAKVVVDLPKDPGVALGPSADHDGIRPSIVQDGGGLLGRVDIAVGKDGNAHRRLDLGDGVVLGLAGIALLAVAAVHRQGPDAGGLGQAGHAYAVVALGAPAGADLERHRDLHRLHHRLEDLRHQRLVAQQGGACCLVAHLLGGAAHVDVDDLGAHLGVAAGRLGEHLGIAAGDLHGAGAGLAAVVHAQPRLAGVPEARVRGDHLAHHQPRAQPAAELPEGAVGDAGHGRQDHPAGEGVVTDLGQGRAGFGHGGGRCWPEGGISYAPRRAG